MFRLRHGSNQSLGVEDILEYVVSSLWTTFLVTVTHSLIAVAYKML